jgi:cell division protein FtsZ
MAAEAAIASPLLEDVDLSGAKGVLVNITAGLDLSIGEFEEVGEVIKSITSESATVVVGTVIDSDLRDEVRVTVIVTGLGRKQAASAFKIPTVEHHVKSLESHTDYEHFDKPTIMRKQAPPVVTTAPATAPVHTQPQTQTLNRAMSSVEKVHDIDYLDIPAFLRRKEEEVQ